MSSSVGSTSDKIPVLRGFSDPSRRENMNKEAPQVGYIIDFQDDKNNRSQASGRKGGNEPFLGDYSVET